MLAVHAANLAPVGRSWRRNRLSRRGRAVEVAREEARRSQRARKVSADIAEVRVQHRHGCIMEFVNALTP